MTVLLDPKLKSEDPEFGLIRDDARFNAQRQLVETLWARYEPHADPRFPQKIARRFHHHFWEMYLSCALMDQGYQLAPKCSDQGPDICVLESDQRIWVEAIAPGRGEGVDAVPLPRVGGQYVPESKVILRLRSAIEEKWRQYDAHLAAQIISPGDSYVVAVNGGDVPFADAVGSGLPYVVQALSGFGPWSVSLDRETLEVREQGYSSRPRVQKARGSQVATDIFVDGGYRGISGVLYSGSKIFNLPVPNGSEFIFVRNGRAANPVRKGWVRGIEFWCEGRAWYRANCGTQTDAQEDAPG